MRFKKTIVLLFLFLSAFGFSQEIPLSPLSKISLLTIGTGEELSSKFGHTAIRIQDPTTDFDVVFGYGGFDFRDPLFYYKFTTGKLDYSMTGHRFNTFLNSYRTENRWMGEQSLDLSVENRNRLFAFLQNNYKEENRNYKYDFLFDNCATKIPEIFKAIFKEDLNFNYNHLEKESTFRQLIHETLETNSWSTLGIDLALGSVIDRKATSWEHQFLPLYVETQFDNLLIDGKPIVTRKEVLNEVRPESKKNSFFLKPLFWLITFLVFVTLITYRDYQSKMRTRWLDFGLFFINGVAGLLIVFLWFATDHSSTKTNFNIFWALAPNLIVAFYMLKRKPPQWISKYTSILLAGIVITGILWIFKIQVFSPLIIFILVALAIRYLFLLSTFKQSKTPTI